MTAGYPSGYNTYVPSFDASGKLVVSFSRNPKEFAVMKYIKLTKAKKSTGYFLRITAEQAARMLTTDGTEFRWPAGANRPSGWTNTEAFEFIPYVTERMDFPFFLDYKAV